MYSSISTMHHSCGPPVPITLKTQLEKEKRNLGSLFEFEHFLATPKLIEVFRFVLGMSPMVTLLGR